MRIPLLVGLLVSALVTPLAAQEDLAHKSIKSLQVALGHWQGSGTMRASPTAPETAWRGSMHFQRILGGHFIQQDAQVVFDGQERPLVMRRIIAFDRGTGRLFDFTADNTGLAEVDEVFWCEGQVLQTISSRIEAGRLIQDDRSYAFSGDRCTVRVRRKAPDGNWFDYVQGSLTRSDANPTDAGVASAAPINPVVDEMGRMQDFVGQWRFSGTFSPLKSGGELPLKGRCEVRSLLGGHALQATYITTDLPGVEGEAKSQVYVSWDPIRNCFRRLVLSDDGRVSEERGYRYRNGDLVYIASQVVDDQPAVRRTLFRMKDDGQRMSAVTDRTVGTRDARQSPILEFVRVNQKGN